jgi:hypothetical protein
VTLVPVEFCQELARGLRAEKITRRLYRLLPPDSAISCASDFRQFKAAPAPEAFNLNSSVELPGLRFVPPDPIRRKAARFADAIAVIHEYIWAAS